MLPPTELRHLYVDFNSYFASVEQQDQPHLRERPIVVIPVDSDATCCIAASIEAKRLGIRTGTPVWEARRLCPNLQTVLASHHKYVDYHQRILLAIDQVMPVGTVCSIDEVDCLLMGPDRRPDQALMLAEAIKETLAREVGPYLRCSIGISTNRLLAKMGTELKKPDGLIVIAPEAIPQRFYRLALRDFCGIGFGMAERLQRAGITTVEQLYGLTRNEFRQIWGGVVGERYYFQLHGYDFSLEESRRSSVGHSQVLSPQLRDPASAYWVMRGLTVRVAARLRRYQSFSGQLTISVRTETRQRYGIVIEERPTHDTWSLLERASRAWERMLPSFDNQRVKKVGIVASQLCDVQPEQMSLFAGEDAMYAKRRQLTAALDGITGRFGRDAVSIGWHPNLRATNQEAKIAFNRVPDFEEYDK